MRLYADTSGLAKIILLEPEAEQMANAIVSADGLMSAAVGYVELRAAVAMALRVGRISEEERQPYRESADR